MNQTLGGVHYDFIDKGISRTGNGVSDEYDMILVNGQWSMVNGQDVAIVEVKYKAHEKDLDKLLTKKYDNFKKLFPVSIPSPKIRPLLHEFCRFLRLGKFYRLS